LIVVHYERCAEKLAYKRQKEKEREKEKEISREKEMELKERDKRKREREGSEETEDTSEDESTEKYSRRKKGKNDCIITWNSGSFFVFMKSNTTSM
jgi:protein FRA10AC1